ncbi:MAG: DNA repair protein RadC [Fibromonadaceae bacterium]|jgi:DNA repair protein RadC|nr:DNA repair protein RadC [Fibromonadaceae bacterium]
MKKDNLLPRERIYAGEISNLSVEELFCVILGRGMPGKSVFSLASEISSLLEKKSCLPRMEELLEIRGLGPAKSAQILACLELSGRFMLGTMAEKIGSPSELMPHLSFLKHLRQEQMVLITMNGGNNIIKIRSISIGSANSTQAHPREAFAPAIEDRAVAVIFAHNHPSGNHEPSVEDLILTRKLCESGQILGIPVLDHLIVSSSGFTSIKSKNREYFETQKPIPISRGVGNA